MHLSMPSYFSRTSSRLNTHMPHFASKGEDTDEGEAASANSPVKTDTYHPSSTQDESHSPAHPAIRYVGAKGKEFLPFRLEQAMSDLTRIPKGAVAIPETPALPALPRSPHTSLVPTVASDIQSWITTPAPSTHLEIEDAISEAGSNHTLPEDDDLDSLDWALFREELPEDKSVHGGKSVKSTKTYSSRAQSEVSDDEDTQSLQKSSDMSDDTYFLMHDANNGKQDNVSQERNSIGHAVNSPIAMPKKEPSLSSLSFSIKSPSEVNRKAQLNRMARELGYGELNRMRLAAMESRPSERALSVSREAEIKRRESVRAAQQQLKMMEHQKIKSICDGFPLPKLRAFQNDFSNKLKYWDAQADKVAQAENITLPELQQRESAVDQRIADINLQLEGLSRGSGKAVSPAERAKQRKSLNSDLEKAVAEKTKLEGHSEAFKPITIGLDQVKLYMTRANSAILLKLNRKLSQVPGDPQGRINLSQELADKFESSELRELEQTIQKKQRQSLQRLHTMETLASSDNRPETLRALHQKFLKTQTETASKGSVLQPLMKEQSDETLVKQLHTLSIQNQEANKNLEYLSRFSTKLPTDTELKDEIRNLNETLDFSSARLDILKKAIEFQPIKVKPTHSIPFSK